MMLKRSQGEELGQQEAGPEATANFPPPTGQVGANSANQVQKAVAKPLPFPGQGAAEVPGISMGSEDKTPPVPGFTFTPPAQG